MPGIGPGLGSLALPSSGLPPGLPAGGTGSPPGGGGSFLPQLLQLLAKSPISYQGSGGQSFSFNPQGNERSEMIKKLMEILGSPQGVGQSAAVPIQHIGGQDTGIQLDTPIGGGGGGGSFLDRPASLSMAPFFR